MTFANLRHLCTIYAGPTHMQLCLVNSLAKQSMKTCKKPSPASVRFKLWIWFELWNSIGIKGKEEVWVCVLTPHWCLSPLVMSQIGHFQFTMCQIKKKTIRLHHCMGEPAIAHISLQPRNSVYSLSEKLPVLPISGSGSKLSWAQRTSEHYL